MVTKLRAILLMEGDFYCHNKCIFSSQMLNLTRDYGLVPDKTFSNKGSTAEDTALLQVLVYNYT